MIENLYFQDNFKVNDRLTLNLGVRFESTKNRGAGMGLL